MLHQQGIKLKLSCGLAFGPGLTGRTWWKGPPSASIFEADGLKENLPSDVLHRPMSVSGPERSSSFREPWFGLEPDKIVMSSLNRTDVIDLGRRGLYRIFKRNLFAIMKGTVMMVATKKNAKINQKKRFMPEFIQPLRPTNLSPDRALSK